MATVQKQAAAAANPVYDQAQQAITGLIPGAEGLYQALIQGLVTQSGQIQQGVVDSANRRGVGRAALADDVGSLLGREVGLQSATLGAQKAEDIANLRGQVGVSNVNRANSISTLADTIQGGEQAQSKLKMEMTEAEREYKLKLQEMERAYEVDNVREQVRAAQAAAAAASKAASSDFEADIQGVLQTVRGGDGRVAPEDYQQALALWTQNGGNPSEFHNKFRWAVNLAHSDDYYRPEIQGEANKRIVQRGQGLVKSYGKPVSSGIVSALQFALRGR